MALISEKSEYESKPWWRYGYVWMFIAGPVSVVFAGFYTFWLALTIPDPIVAEDYYQKGININKTLPDEKVKPLVPALKGRNHVVTPLQDRPKD